MSKITRAPVKYVTNKELLAEIAKCKNSFCSFIDPEHSQYDTITGDLDTITREVIDEVLEKINSKAETPRGRDGFIVRVMTHDHVPIDPERKRKSRVTNQNHAKTNFPPFKHFQLKERDGEMIWTEVGRSHWVGGFENGYFTTDAGRMTDRLGRMFMMLVNRYSMRSNWRGYTYRDEMCGLALMHLSQVGLQFDESKSNNPFAFFTTTIMHCFTRQLTLEKKNQTIRDDLLINMGMAPSYTRQIDDEMNHGAPKKIPGKRGRKSAATIAAEAAVEKAKKESEERDF